MSGGFFFYEVRFTRLLTPLILRNCAPQNKASTNAAVNLCATNVEYKSTRTPSRTQYAHTYLTNKSTTENC